MESLWSGARGAGGPGRGPRRRSVVRGGSGAAAVTTYTECGAAGDNLSTPVNTRDTSDQTLENYLLLMIGSSVASEQ